MAKSPLTAADKEELLIIKENNAAEIETALNKAYVMALEKIGLVAEGYAKRKCPVDTGRLRASITHQIDSGAKAVYIGTNVEYGPCVEFGTERQSAQPYLRPAATEHTDHYKKILKNTLESS